MLVGVLCVPAVCREQRQAEGHGGRPAIQENVTTNLVITKKGTNEFFSTGTCAGAIARL